MLARRLLAALPLVLVLMPGGHASAAGPDGATVPDAFDRLDRSQRAADGARSRAQADGWAEGVVRRSASLRDVESTSANPQHQLTSVDVAVDLEAQVLTTTASFAQAPTDAEAVLGVVLGTWDGRSCVSAFTALTTTVSSQVQGQFTDGTGVPLSRTVGGASVTLTSAAHPLLRDSAFECAYAVVLPTDQNGAVLSRAFAEALDETHRPALEVDPDQLMVGARAGRWASLRVTLRNTGKGDAGPVRLTAAGSGVQVRPGVVELPALAGRSSEYVELKIRLTAPKKAKGKGKKGKRTKSAKAPRPRPVTLTATSAGASPATARPQVAITPKPTVPKKLEGSYWWGWESTTTMSSAGWITHGVWFVDAKWAYTGWAEGRRPRCSAKVKECQRYTYNKRKGVVKIGKKRAKVTSEGFAFVHPGAGEKLDFHPLTLPAKGTKLQTDLIHQNWSGTCMLMCNSWTENLSFGSDGRFALSRVTIGSWPGLGSVWSILPPDQRGTYRVVRKGIVELTYDDGTRKRHVIGIEHDPSGKPNPVAAGLLLDDVNYYH
ncbi:hypothetical protein [Nocardioides solisilvae]|uniref:hypothetical protein n=1 Tax=Nocardioides solisilvae TaxID=1542435 RepID=UPI0013A52FBB|nr:hypothetical protein [Nocardioides solisilvae]